jgi:hypothetical protein
LRFSNIVRALSELWPFLVIAFLLAAARTEWRFGRDRRRHVDPHD